MSREQNTHVELLAALTQAVREFSTLSVLFSLKVGERLGMNPSDMECLDLLNLLGPLSAGQLAGLTGLTTGAITAMVDRLEQAGYVQRERDTHDRRRVIVQRVAEKVEQEVTPFFASKLQAWNALCSHYSDEQLALILDFLERSKQMNRDQLTALRAERSAGKHPRR